MSFIINIKAVDILPCFCCDDNLWIDEFENDLCIDLDKSSEAIIVDDGVVKFKDTYSFWEDWLEWERLKVINVHNKLPDEQENVKFHIKVERDDEDSMQGNFQDLRFINEYNGEHLNHWIENLVDVDGDGKNEHANIWVEIDYLPGDDNDGNPGETNICMLYGTGSDNEKTWDLDFEDIFVEDDWSLSADKKITSDESTYGSYNPVVCHGEVNDTDYFLVAWHQGPTNEEDNGYKQEIQLALYDVDQEGIVSEITIPTSGNYYRHNNPSVAFCSDTWLIVWEYYDNPWNLKNPPPASMDIKYGIASINNNGDLVFVDKGLINDYDLLHVICELEPFVVSDPEHERFLVLWTDFQDLNDFEIYARLCKSDGEKLGNGAAKITNDDIINGAPWAAYNPDESEYLIVYETGEMSDGFFCSSIKGKLSKHDLSSVGSEKDIIDYSAQTSKYNPCVEYSEVTNRYFVTWNEARKDTSYGKAYYGVTGALIDEDGGVIFDNLEIKTACYNGIDYQNNIVPYLNSSYIVSYNEGELSHIIGELVNSYNEGLNFNNAKDIEFVLSGADSEASNSYVDGYENKVFVVWEDLRSDTREIWGSIGYLHDQENQMVISPENEVIKQINHVEVISDEIKPTDLESWGTFHETSYQYGNSEINYYLLNGTSLEVIKSIQNGEDLGTTLSDIQNYPSIRLKATLNRPNPSDTPYIDVWNVSYVGGGGQFPQDPNELILSVEYDNPKEYYKEGDKVRIYANLSSIEEINSDSKVNITIEDATRTVLLESWPMELRECDESTCSWYHEWIVNGSAIASDGYVTVTISAEFVNKLITIADPNYDDSKNIDNTKPSIEGPIHYTTGFDSATIICTIWDLKSDYVILEYAKSEAELDNTENKRISTADTHTFLLSGLDENMTYYYQITAYDKAENFNKSTGHWFTTGEGFSNEDVEQHARADADGPYFGNVGKEITFNGSGSKSSPNGIIRLYTWDFENDGIYDRQSVLPTVTHSYSKVGNYTVKLQIEDTNDETSTDTAPVIIIDSNTIELENLTSNNKTTIDIPETSDTIIVYVEVIPAENIPNVAATIVDYGKNRPDNVPQNPTIEDIGSNKTLENMSIFRFVDITFKSNDVTVEESKINKTEIVFKVENEWMEDNDIHEATITMLRYHNNSWQELDTTYLNTVIEYSYYLSTTSGFSTFAVVGSKVVEEGKASEDEPEIPWIIIIGFIIAAIALLIFILFKAKLIYIEEVDAK